MLLPILSGASLILGLYLIFVHFFTKQSSPTPSDTTYHIGCYDPSYANNHSWSLLERLEKIEHNARQSTKLNMFNSKGLRPDFDRDVRQVAASFDTFLSQYYKNKGASEYNVNYYNSVRLAKMEFKECAGRVYFDEKECLRAWEEYKNSKLLFDGAKKEISELVEIKQRNQIALAGIVLKRPNINQDEMQKNYRIKIAQIKQLIDQGEQALIQFRTTKNKIRSELNYIDGDLAQLKGILEQCVNNQQLIIYCNKISKQVNRIEQAAPTMAKKELENRLAKKLLIISAIEMNIKKATRAGEVQDIAKLERQLDHQQRELALLEHQIENFQTKEESKCAMCSEERIKQLRKNISDLEDRKSQLQRNSIKIQTDITDAELKLGTNKKQLQKIQQQKQTFTISQFCLDEKCKLEQRNSIADKERALNELKKRIIDKQIEVGSLGSAFGSRANGIKEYLEGVDRIVGCLGKKEYLEELKKKKPSQSQVDTKMLDAQRSMVKQLNDFQL